MNDTQIYTKEELQLFKEIENKKYSAISEQEFQKKKDFFKKVATDTIAKKTKKKSLNIRLFEDDVLKIKAIALSEGMPYQTYIASMIHKIANNKSA